MINKLFLILIIISLSFSSFYGESTDYEYTVFSIDDKEIINPLVLTEEEKIGQIANDYFDLKNKNSDTVGWINIPHVCYYPVMFSGDQFYLRKDVNKRYRYSGSIFMNPNSGGDFDNTALLHGHHMKNGTMFAGLKKYTFKDFFQNNDCIEVFDGENLRYYKPYTVIYMKDGSEFLKQQLQGETREEYFKSLQERSVVPMEEGLTPNFSADMLYLSTCDYLFENCRLLVGCYLIKTVPLE